ncbi:MAG: hypothetical protein NZL85_11845 [Fimbriimonadales bacterium]|nr:hypothetical protein [Fimbriimonadales bacterium]
MRRYLPSCLMVVGLLLLGACLLSYLWVRPPRIEIPPRRYPPDNAYDYYKVLAASVMNTHRADPQLHNLLNAIERGASIDAAEYAYLQQVYEPILTEYRRHLDKPSAVVLEYDIDYPMPELQSFREMIRIEHALMDYELRHGRTWQALERFDSVVRFSQQIRDEGSLIHFLVGQGQITTAALPMAQHLPTFNRAALERVLAICRRYEQERVPLVEGMRPERFWGISAIKQLREGHYHPQPNDPSGLSDIVVLMRIPLVQDAIYASGLREYDRYMKRVIAEIEKPHWQRKPIPEPEARGLAGMLVAILIPVFSHVTTKEAMEQTQMRLLGCAAAIRLHKLRTGHYPARLEELNLGDMIIDPFTGQPFRYKTDPRKGFLLYSVGGNQKDEGGWRTAEGDLSKGDVGVVPYRPQRHPGGSIQAVPLGAPVWIR